VNKISDNKTLLE